MGWIFDRICLVGSILWIIDPHESLHEGQRLIPPGDKGLVVEELGEEDDKEKDGEEDEGEDEELGEDMTNLSEWRENTSPKWLGSEVGVK